MVREDLPADEQDLSGNGMNGVRTGTKHILTGMHLDRSRTNRIGTGTPPNATGIIPVGSETSTVWSEMNLNLTGIIAVGSGINADLSGTCPPKA
jgi:hypothetical protein